MSAAIVWKIDPFASEQSDQSAQSGLKRGRGFNNVTEVLLSTKMGQFSLCCRGAQRLKSSASRSTLFFAAVPNLEYVLICNPASVQASLRGQLLCEKFDPEKYSLMSINVLIQI